MSQQLHSGIGRVSLAQGAYSLVFGGLLLLGGWCSDRFGALRVLRWALFGFALAGGAVVATNSIEPVIVVRALQGSCAALAAPASLALLISLPPPARRRGLSWFSAVGAVGLAAGVGLGTPLIAFFGWKAGFIGPTIIALALLVCSTVMGRSGARRRRPPAERTVHPPLLLSAAVILLLAAAETTLLVKAWWPPLVALAGAAPLLAAVVHADAHRPRPVIPPAMFDDMVTRGGLVLMAAFGGWQAAEVLLLAVQFDSLRASSPWLAGLPFWVQGAVALLCAPLIQRMCRAPGTTCSVMAVSPWLAGAGFLAIGAGRSTAVAGACLATVVFGISAVSASTAATLTTAAVPGAPPGRVGAIMTSARQLGTSAGTSVVGALLSVPVGSPGGVGALTTGAATVALGCVLMRVRRRGT